MLAQVTLGRHTGKDAALQPVCALSRTKGVCHVHGKEEDWKDGTQPVKGTSDGAKNAAQRLWDANCYSSTYLRIPPSAPVTEPFRVAVPYLRLMYEGFVYEPLPAAFGARCRGSSGFEGDRVVCRRPRPGRGGKEPRGRARIGGGVLARRRNDSSDTP